MFAWSSLNTDNDEILETPLPDEEVDTEDFDYESVDWINNSNDSVVDIDFWDNPDTLKGFALQCYLTHDGSSQYQAEVGLKIWHASLMQTVDIENVITKDFFIHTEGRRLVNGNNFPSTAIDILDKELKGDYEYLLKQDLIGLTMQDNIKLAFSQSDSKNAREFLNELASNSTYVIMFKSSGELAFLNLNNPTISDATKGRIEANIDDIIKLDWKLSDINKVKTSVKVKYKMDYMTKELLKETKYIDAYDLFANWDLKEEENFEDNINRGYGYSKKTYGLNPDNRYDSHLVFEAKYIRDEQSAYALAYFLLCMKCNQHLIGEIELPLKYLNIEAGDTISFSGEITSYYRRNDKAGGISFPPSITSIAQLDKISLPDNNIELNPFGINVMWTGDETQINSQQFINNNFLVTKVLKNDKKVKVTFRMMPSIPFNPDFYPVGQNNTPYKNFEKGDINRSGLINHKDLDTLNVFLNTGNQDILSYKQFKLADINDDGHITEEDSSLLNEIIYPQGLGDIEILELLGETETSEAIEHPHRPNLDKNYSNSGLEIGLANNYSTDFGFFKWAYVDALSDLVDFPPLQLDQNDLETIEYEFTNFIGDAINPSHESNGRSVFAWCIFKDWENLETTGYPNMDIGTVIQIGSEYIYIYDKIELNTYNENVFYTDEKYNRNSACMYKVTRNVPVILNGEYINSLENIPNHTRDETVKIYSSRLINFDDDVDLRPLPQDNAEGVVQ